MTRRSQPWGLAVLLLLCLLNNLQAKAAHLDHSPDLLALNQPDGPAVYDSAAAKYLPLEKWLQQSEQHNCLGDTQADILFAVDGSESVSLTDFHLVVKSVLVDTISRLPVGESLVQVGVLVFSSQVSQVIPIGQHRDKLSLLRAVSHLAYAGGFTSIDAAVEGCIAELGRRDAEIAAASQTEDGGKADEERKRIVVFVTDGRHTDSLHGVYVHDLLARLHRRATAVVALGLQNSDAPMMQGLASDAGLVFDPTAYPDYQNALHGLLNMRCSAACFQYEQRAAASGKVAGTLVRYVNYLVESFVSYQRQFRELEDYAGGVNRSATELQSDIERTCNAEDSGLLRHIATLEGRIRSETNGSRFTTGASIDVYVEAMLRRVAILQREGFQQSQSLATERARLAGMDLQEDRMGADFQTRLDSKLAVRRAQEKSLAALESRVAAYREELQTIGQSITRFENLSISLTTRLSRQEAVYTERQARLSSLTQENGVLAAVNIGGGSQLTDMTRRLALCQDHLRGGGVSVLFAIRCGSGADFAALFDRSEASFSDDANGFQGLSDQHPVFKSPFLHHLHTMGYFDSITWQFMDTQEEVVGSLTMDTSRVELISLFSRARVTASFPWVAAYANAIYRASLDRFRAPSETAEFLLVYGDLRRYHDSGSCADIRGIFLVLARPHRCYPEAVAFPAVYISASPFGGAISRPVAELRLVTHLLPSDRTPASQLPPLADPVSSAEQVTEVLLYVKSGAGYLHSLLLSSQFTPAAALAEVDDLSQLARHYKSSLLANNRLHLENYLAIRLELFDRAGHVVAALRFKGPFDVRDQRTAAGGDNRTAAAEAEEFEEAPVAGWEWFQPKYLDSATPFSLHRLRSSARFTFYTGNQFFVIGEHLAASDCRQRDYYLAVLDSPDACGCLATDSTTAKTAKRTTTATQHPPVVVFADGRGQADGGRPLPCSRLTTVDGLRLTGELVRPVRSAME